MKKLIVLVVIVAATVAGVHFYKIKDKESFTKYSSVRVERMLEGIMSGSSGQEQESIGYWYNGDPRTAVDEPMADAFDAFKKKKGISRVSSYEILSATLVNGEDQVNRHVEVRFKANGKEMAVVVRHKQTMEWLQ